MEDGQVVHYFDPEHFLANPAGLGDIVRQGLAIESSHERLVGTVSKVRVYRVGEQPGFATLDEAKQSLGKDEFSADIAAPLTRAMRLWTSCCTMLPAVAFVNTRFPAL